MDLHRILGESVPHLILPTDCWRPSSCGEAVLFWESGPPMGLLPARQWSRSPLPVWRK